MCERFRAALIDDDSPRFRPANAPGVFKPFFKAAPPSCPGSVRCDGTRPCAASHLNRTFETCSLVGSSWILLDSRQGPAIDAAELVIRINAHPVKGRERDVGARTDVRLINNELCTRFAEEKGVEADVVVGVLELCWRFKPTPKLCPRIPHMMFITERWMNMPSEFLDRTARIVDPQGRWKVQGKWPSNGIRAIMVMLRSCRKIRVYGMASVFDDYIRSFDAASGNKSAVSNQLYSFSGLGRHLVMGMPHDMLGEALLAHTLARCFPDRLELVI